MCGISGIFNFDETPVSQDKINILTDALAHRGPDGRGIWFNNEKNLAFGHRRLAIIDLSIAAKQPMSWADGRYWITYNGEIFNFIEIRDELFQKGYCFKTQSDTEIILAAYNEWGENMLERFNGMWAFAIFDNNTQSLFLSRDRYGIKPLYYYNKNYIFIFASEVQAIQKILGNNFSLNTEVIRDISVGSFSYHGTIQTYIKDIHSLPGGYNLSIRNKKIRIKEWYSLKKMSVPPDFKNQAIALKNIIMESCKVRLRSDVPIGTCLSGGLDSGSIAAIVDTFNSVSSNPLSKYSHHAFFAQLLNSPFDESESANTLAAELRLKLNTLEIHSPTPEELEEALHQCDGPMHGLAFFPIWLLFRYIKSKNIIVTLDGQGPDEMLGGYRPLYEALETAIESKDPLWFWNVYKTYSKQGESLQLSSKKIAREILWNVFNKHFLNIRSMLAFSKKDFYLKRDTDLSTLSENYEIDLEYLNTPVRNIPIGNTILDRSLYQQFFQSPLPAILNQFDRCSMANGVECRMPFMDHRIVEFIFSLPVKSKVGGGYTKRVLREAMKGLLPDSVRLNKVKIGFNAPIVEWFRSSLKDWMMDQMNTSVFRNSEYFNGSQLKTEYELFLNKKNPEWVEANKFWAPVHIAWWANNQRQSKMC